MEELDENKERKLDDFKTSPANSDGVKFSPDFADNSANISEIGADEEDEVVDPMNGFDDEAAKESSAEKHEPNEEKKEDKKDEKEEDQSESKSSEHDGYNFVIPRGKAMCDKGSTFPNFKVTSHQKHYWNDAEGSADHLAVTEDDLQFNPPATPFGSCAVKNGNPCTYAPAGKWTKTYDKVKVMGKSCLTEKSSLMCTVGGKITVMKHGQQSEAGKSNVANADSREQHIYNPFMDFDEFKEEIEESDKRHAW
ncbi:DUF4280 domain-containing protein [Halpernia frigidisoli]|uniref:DUF4280 domain-containing protein n=1 Tax=Halpernia frigidisoli TaxID=1125876 RepID=A0A1I3IQR1_9FLAO|nr:DUF4280 domain-containing protein [Halpernia frigidisoli]SFI50229.1 protein of unknown function [Halpernia frigidisoli]